MSYELISAKDSRLVHLDSGKREARFPGRELAVTLCGRAIVVALRSDEADVARKRSRYFERCRRCQTRRKY